MRYLSILLFLLLAQSVSAQRLIRRSSRHYVAAQELPSRVDPLLNDDWHQYSPYNSMCPLDEQGERCIIGCVATAMAQVMHYWEWPKQGNGYHEYKDSTGCKQVLSANFSEHFYDWDNMLYEYLDGNYTQEQLDAVSLLGLDCGIAVNMRYGSGSSGARSIYQPMALANYFRYDPGVQLYFRDFYSLSELTLMLKRELAAGRPVLVSGYNTTMGHAFVIDGYNENEEFHMALGMGGHYGDGWTPIPYMTPWQADWYDIDSPENGMNLLQMYVMGIMPDNHPEATGIERHLFAFQGIRAVTSENHPKPVYRRNEVKLTVHDLSNVGWNLLADSVVIMLKKGDELIRPLYTYSRTFQLEEVDDTTYTDTLSLSIPPQVAEGAYTLVPMYRDNSLEGGKEWREARTSTGTPNYLIANVQAQDVTLSSDTASTAFLTIEDLDFPDMIVLDTRPDYTITLKNHNAEMAGRIYCVMEGLEPGSPSFYLMKQGITLLKDEVTTYRFHRTWVNYPHIGQYRLHILYEANLFADNLIELPLPEEKIVTIIRSRDMELAQHSAVRIGNR